MLLIHIHMILIAAVFDAMPDRPPGLGICLATLSRVPPLGGQSPTRRMVAFSSRVLG